MQKVIHLSDFHIGCSTDELPNGCRIRDHLLDHFQDGIVVITGDHTHHGTVAEFDAFQANILNPLRERFTVLTCPGNHDYGSGWFGVSQDAIAGFQNYINPNPYPQVHIAGSLAFIGLDSADPSNKVLFASGLLIDQQLSALASAIIEYPSLAKIIYLHHHPFLYRIGSILWGGSKLLKIASVTNLMLFGHKHINEVIAKSPLMLASSKITQPINDMLSFRVVEFDGISIARTYMEYVRR